MEEERADALEVAAQEDEESEETKEDAGDLRSYIYFLCVLIKWLILYRMEFCEVRFPRKRSFRGAKNRSF